MPSLPCGCETAHREGAVFYISAMDGPRRATLAGPYATHEAAQADVAPVRAWACGVDPWLDFAAFGTMSIVLPEGVVPAVGKYQQKVLDSVPSLP